MENRVWTRVAGLPETQIYPYLRKPDIVSSNSFIIADESRIVVIDPGGLPDQAATLAAEINRIQDEGERPVSVYLTHSHLDHCLQLMQILDVRSSRPVSVVAHAYAADALEGQDRRATFADVTELEMAKISVGTRLFTPGDEGSAVGVCSEHEGELRCTIMPGENGLAVPIAERPAGIPIVWHHTPGHTPDSISIRIGPLLFLGDIPFAASPGIAGVYGWNHQDLIASIGKIHRLLAEGEITSCFPGHGAIFSAGEAGELLRSVQREAAKLGDVHQISPERVQALATHAADIMAEIDRLFTIIAGRLLFVTHILDELEEAGEAERLRGSVDPDFIEQMLAGFGQFSSGFRDQKGGDIHIALKAGQITAKLARCYDTCGLARIIDPSFTRRVANLLRDYSVTFRGYDPAPALSPTDCSALVRDLARSIAEKPFDEAAILDAGDDEAYLDALVARIAYVNPLESLAISTRCGDDTICRMDPERTRDLLRHILELYAVAGVAEVTFAAAREDRQVALTVSAPQTRELPLDSRGWRFLTRSTALCGGHLDDREDGAIRITFDAGAGVI